MTIAVNTIQCFLLAPLNQMNLNNYVALLKHAITCYIGVIGKSITIKKNKLIAVLLFLFQSPVICTFLLQGNCA